MMIPQKVVHPPWQPLAQTPLHRGRIEIDILQGGRNFKVALNLVTKGDVGKANQVHCYIPGLGTDARGFRPSLEAFQPGPGEAAICASLLGAGSFIPKGLSLTPQVLVELYLQTLLRLSPQITPQRGLIVVGNSMGAQIAAGVAMSFYQETGKVAHCIFDNPMSPDIVGKTIGSFLGETQSPLHQILCITQRYTAPLFGHYALWAGFRILFSSNWLFEKFVWSLYTAPRQEDFDYFRDLYFNKPTLVGGMSVFEILAQIGTHIDGYRDYFSQFKDRVRDTTYILPGHALIVRSEKDRVFNPQNSKRIQSRIFRNSDGSSIPLVTREGPHLETSPRALEGIQELCTDLALSY